MEIKGKVAWVSGAGGAIGRATCLALAEKGAARLYVVDMDTHSALGTVDILDKMGVEAQVQVVDVANSLEVTAALDRAVLDGPIDIVFNNAGMVVGDPLYPETSLARIEQIIAVNLTSVAVATQRAAQLMRGRGGVIVNTSSVVANHRGFADYLYTVTKAAVLALTECCAPLHQSWNIRVAAVLPGLVDSPVVHAMGKMAVPILLDNIPMPPSRVAQAVIALIEDESNAGQYLVVPHDTRDAVAT